MPSTKPITISNWNTGGLSDSKWSGVPNSLFKIIGLDPHSEPGVIQAAQKLTKDSSTTITEFVKNQVVSSNGRTYHGSSESGKIWERTAADTYTLVHTIVAGNGESKILGMFEYQGYIYIATETRLHRILATDAEGASEWTANIATDWASFSIGDTEFHPMTEQNQILYIGDGNYVAQVEDGTFTANALDIKDPLRIKCLGKIGTDLLLGTYVDDNINKTQILRWNTWGVSFTNLDEIQEVGVNAFLESDNKVYVNAGKYGNIYEYDGYTLQLYNKVPATNTPYSPTATCTVHPDATANLDNQVLFGVSNVAGNPCDQGVYRIARHSTNYPWIMDLPYPISQRSGSDLVLTGVEIGSIEVLGQKILVSWKYNSTYGVDLLDADTKLDGAFFETRVMRPDRMMQTTFRQFIMAYNALPASTDLVISYDKNYTGDYTTNAVVSSHIPDTDRKFISLEEGIEAVALQLKVVFTTNANTTPSLEILDIYYR